MYIVIWIVLNVVKYSQKLDRKNSVFLTSLAWYIPSPMQMKRPGYEAEVSQPTSFQRLIVFDKIIMVPALNIVVGGAVIHTACVRLLPAPRY